MKTAGILPLLSVPYLSPLSNVKAFPACLPVTVEALVIPEHSQLSQQTSEWSFLLGERPVR